jgi:ATP-binding cassette subfamily F protein 3
MSLVTLSDIEKSYGTRVLFDRLQFALERGERVGLIGANGAGKSTLFKIILNEVMPERGAVGVAKSLKIGLLDQDPVFDPANTVVDEAELAYAELHRLAHEMREMEHAMADATGPALEKVLDEYQHTQHEFDLAGGYVWHHKLEATLLGIGLDRPTWEQNVTTLSGGQRSRLALVKLLISEPDVMLLDEPTNHLDLAAIEWLEKYLLGYNGATLLISHDRYLLDRLATRIVWLTRSQLSSYPGNYSAFVSQREIAELSQQRAYEQQQADIEKQKEFIRRFGAGQRAREAKGREKRLNRLLVSDEMISSVATQKQLNLKLGVDRRAGDQVLQVRGLSKAYDQRPLWQDIELDVKRGERIGLIGPNGSGKTTLLETLLGRREPDAGKVKWGANLKIGYYDQKIDDFDPNSTVVDQVRSRVQRELKDQELRDALGALLFSGDDALKQISLLSGGERARVSLAILLLDKPNVLVLDEPTNHLDIASREALEQTLQNYDGTIFCVSHDRYFLDQVVQRLLILQPPGIVDFEGNYSGWMKKQSQVASAAAAELVRSKSPPPKSNPKQPAKQTPKSATNNPYARPFGRLTTEELEKQIQQTEASITECQGIFSSSARFKDAAAKRKLENDYQKLQQRLKELEQEYFAREAS